MGHGEGSGSGKGAGTGAGGGAYRGKDERLAVPAMPYPMSITCCILNFLVPGLGTMIAGTSNFCCSRNEDMTTGTRWGSCCLSLGIGFLQLLTTAFFLIGWGWSIVWGVFFIMMSHEYYYNNRVSDTDGRSGMVLTTQPTNQIIITNPGQGVVYGNMTQAHTHTVTFINQPPGPRFGPSVNQSAVMAAQTAQAQAQFTTYNTSGMVNPPPYPGPPQTAYGDHKDGGPPPSFPPPPPSYM